MDEDKLAEQLETYRKLGEQDKNVDVAGLMMRALQKQETNRLSPRQKRWAYLISIGLPPFGLIFALKFFFSDKDDGRQTATICAVLTFVSLFLTWLLGKALLSGSNVNLQELQQISPQDIRELYQ